MSAQYDLEPGLNISALSSATAAQLMQLISQAAPLVNIGGIIFQSTTPDVASNSRFARYIWLDSSSDPAVPKYYNAGTTSWTAVAVAALSITNAEISASAAIAVTKLANGTARYILRTNAAGTANEFVAPTAILNSDELAVVKLTSNGGTDGYLKSVSGVTQWIANATERAAIAASLNSLSPTVLAAGTNNTLLGTNSSGVVAFDSPANLLSNGSIGLALLAAGGASLGDVLSYNGSNWVKYTPTLSIANSISANSGVTFANALNSGTLTESIDIGLGANTLPKIGRFVVLCTANDAASGYSLNDEIDPDSFMGNAGGDQLFSCGFVYATGYACYGKITGTVGNIYIVPKSGGAAVNPSSAANFKMKVYAWK